MSAMMERYAAYDLGELLIPEGENRKGEKYMEFYLDEDAFDKMIVKLLECERIREKDLDIPLSGKELPAMSVGWRVSVTPEQEYALGDRFEEYKLQSAKVFEEEE